MIDALGANKFAVLFAKWRWSLAMIGGLLIAWMAATIYLRQDSEPDWIWTYDDSYMVHQKNSRGNRRITSKVEAIFL